MAPPEKSRKRVRSEAEEIVPASIEDQDLAAPSKKKKARTEEKRSLFVRSLPADATTESLTDLFSQYFPVKHAIVVADPKTKESRGYGFVTLADAEDAVEAQKALDKKPWNGRNIRIDIAEPRHRNDPVAKAKLPPGKPSKEPFAPAPKLIVRNLPWSIKTSEQLTNLFRSFGKVKFADLPQNKGKLKGFGFVTLRGQKNAEKALEAINGKEIDGRTIAVDWAVDKKTWEQQNGDEEAGEKKADSEAEDEDDEMDDQDGKKDGDKPALDADLENFMKNHFGNLEEEDDDDEDDEDEDEDEDAQMLKEAHKTASKPLQNNDSSTIFIRNLPFTATDESLKSFFTSFGTVRYARIVMDKATDKPAGTGFVCFVKEDDAKECIKAAPRSKQPAMSAGTKHSILQDESADPDGKHTMEGRLLSVAQAVNKAQAAHLADSSQEKRNQRDKRRLFLMSEGHIGRGSPLFDLLSDVEVRMRQASAAQRKKLVQSNPSLHISLTRLALRNIPRDITSKDLKELARKAVVGFATDVKEGRRQPLSKEENARDGKDAKEREQERRLKGKGVVRQSKIVFESKEGSKVAEKSGAGKSRGYGFIEYSNHHWALMGLRWLNGHQLQGDNGKKQRLVVEFAIENANVVQRRRKTEDQSSQPAKPKNAKGEKESKSASKSDKDGKGKKVKGKKARKQAKEAEVEVEQEEAKPADPKEAMKQKLIARKRQTRKKKAVARGNK